jgi:glycerophosphoryl diester phosphodiesterase
VPQLEDLLELCKGRVVPMIEIKDKLSLAPKLGQLVVKALADIDMLSEAVVIIRDRARALEFAEIAPQLAISMVTFSWLQTRGLSPQNNILGLDHYWKTLSPRLLRSVRAAGMFITPWTINSRADMQRCLANGCECLLTDIPALLNDLLEELELSQVRMPDRSQDLATESSDELEVVSESELESLVDQA